MKNGTIYFTARKCKLWAKWMIITTPFLDRPKGNQINAAYLLDYNDLENSGFGSHFGIQYLVDKRIVGQVGFDDKLPQISQNKYGGILTSIVFRFGTKQVTFSKENLTKASV